MTHVINLVWMVFGRLTVLNRKWKTPHGNITWECECECWNKKIVAWGNLRWWSTVSCGCYISERLKERHTTHGMKWTRPYNIYRTMISRCYNQNATNYWDYWWRWITICNRWRESFVNFWEDMWWSYFEWWSIDRIDTNEEYSLNNCRWTTSKEQSRNRRSNRIIKYNGEELCLMDWAKKLWISHQKLSYRINAGWDIHRIFNTK